MLDAGYSIKKAKGQRQKGQEKESRKQYLKFRKSWELDAGLRVKGKGKNSPRIIRWSRPARLLTGSGVAGHKLNTECWIIGKGKKGNG
jgi:hypothetical protein